MASLKELSAKRITKKVKFMGENVEISKLTVMETMEIQELSKELESSSDDNSGFAIIKCILCKAVEGADELTDDDFDNFPLEELSTLSTHIMQFSGMGTEDKGK